MRPPHPVNVFIGLLLGIGFGLILWGLFTHASAAEINCSFDGGAEAINIANTPNTSTTIKYWPAFGTYGLWTSTSTFITDEAIFPSSNFTLNSILLRTRRGGYGGSGNSTSTWLEIYEANAYGTTGIKIATSTSIGVNSWSVPNPANSSTWSMYNFPSAPSFLTGRYYTITLGANDTFLTTFYRKQVPLQEDCEPLHSNTGVNQYLPQSYITYNSSTPATYITLTYPVNGTSTPDFGLFRGAWAASTSTSPNLATCIDYGTNSSSLQYTDCTWLGYYATPGNYNVQKSNSTAPGLYYALARLTDFLGCDVMLGQCSYDLLATSSLISYTQTTAGDPFFPTGYTGTTTAFYLPTCDNVDGSFAYMLCRLFVPSASTTALFGGFKDTLITKPPLGYFVLISAALTTIDTSTSSFSFDLSGIALFADVRTALIWLFWTLLAFGLLHKIRKFKP